MAERRMFAKTIIDSDAFIDMPVTARLLYYDLGMRADDDGFINSPKKIMRMIGASEDDMRILITRKFIIPFDTGVVVIKHWRINNYLRSDRYKETSYQEEKKALTVKENGAYSITGTPVVDQAVYQRDTQDSIGKDSIGKDSIGKDSIGKDSIGKDSIGKNNINRRTFVPPTVEEVEAYCRERRNNVDANAFIDFYTSKDWMIGKNKMKNWKAAVRTWEKRGTGKQTQFNTFEQRNYNYSELERKLLGG